MFYSFGIGKLKIEFLLGFLLDNYDIVYFIREDLYFFIVEVLKGNCLNFFVKLFNVRFKKYVLEVLFLILLF